ncbi:hypothetical protein SAMN04515618_11811 [Collimonas sp. OK307]|nr:hypothetical protein SAMN04515618_11811 [Collimonas sp. OK307]
MSAPSFGLQSIESLTISVITPGAEAEVPLPRWDEVAITFSIPAALFISPGYSVEVIGTWPAIILWSSIQRPAVESSGSNHSGQELRCLLPASMQGIKVCASTGN